MLVVTVSRDERGERVDAIWFVWTRAEPVSIFCAHAVEAAHNTEICSSAVRSARCEGDLFCRRSCVPGTQNWARRQRRRQRRSGRVDGRDEALAAVNGSHGYDGAKGTGTAEASVSERRLRFRWRGDEER